MQSERHSSFYPLLSAPCPQQLFEIFPFKTLLHAIGRPLRKSFPFSLPLSYAIIYAEQKTGVLSLIDPVSLRADGFSPILSWSFELGHLIIIYCSEAHI